ncbi:MAG: Ldh family oxidoreductase [Pseudomonadota bacterium]
MAHNIGTPTQSLTLAEIEDLATRVFAFNGCDAANAGALTRTVVSAERDGALSHGLFRVPGYVASLRSGKVNGAADPGVQKELPAVVRVDGDNGFTPLAIERGIPVLADAAKRLGVAVLTIRRTHHFAALWPETEALAEQGLFGFACVNNIPVMAPHGGASPLFGTNPLAWSWPRPGRPPVTCDMATSAMAHGDIQIAAREGEQLPLGCGVDAAGQPTTDPAAILAGSLLPFGGHKGSAMALLVELLAGGAINEVFSYEAEAADNGDGGPVTGGEFILALAPELLAGDQWPSHCEAFFQRFEAMQGTRLPGAARHRKRSEDSTREVNRTLLAEIESLSR